MYPDLEIRAANMTPPRYILKGDDRPLSHQYVPLSESNQQQLSVSPTATFLPPPTSSSTGGGALSRSSTGVPKDLKPFHTQDIRILLLENVNQTGLEVLRAQGYQVEALKTSLPEDELIRRIQSVTQQSQPKERHRSRCFLDTRQTHKLTIYCF